MSKYTVGDNFKTRTNKKLIKLKILFVPAVDWLGIQYYLFERYDDGKSDMSVELMEERELDKYYDKVS